MGLSVENLSFSYEDVQVLNDVSFSINEPSVVGIIGPNGSGKSTLVKNILGVLQPDSGRVSFDRRSIDGMSLTDKAKMMSYVPQSITPNFSHSVYYTVLMGRKPYIGWTYTENDKTFADNILEELNLGSLRNRMFSTLSGGEKQKTILARAIAQDCDMVVLDEPTSNLDLHHQQEVLNFLRDLSSHHQVIVLMVIHDLNLASMYCDRIILLNEGEIKVDGTPSQVITKEHLKTFYEVDADILTNGGRPHILLRE